MAVGLDRHACSLAAINVAQSHPLEEEGVEVVSYRRTGSSTLDASGELTEPP